MLSVRGVTETNSLRSLGAALLIVLLIGGIAFYRYTQLPKFVDVSAKVSLWRRNNYGSATLNAVSFTLTPESLGDRDNVSLRWAAGEGNLTSTAHWKIVIIVNESASGNLIWEHEILPNTDKAGEYEGVVSTSLYLKGAFTIWVVLSSIQNGVWVAEPSFSQRIITY